MIARPGGTSSAAPDQSRTANSRARIQCFSSNVPFGTYPDLQSRLLPITLLREPITRTISLYVYRKAQEQAIGTWVEF